MSSTIRNFFFDLSKPPGATTLAKLQFLNLLFKLGVGNDELNRIANKYQDTTKSTQAEGAATELLDAAGPQNVSPSERTAIYTFMVAFLKTGRTK
ncbi:MAG: hypothetical protein NUW37_18495 [Planctomycetes bacterium]|nr:hypothetical protein [Planctomycetota bacterium]